MKCSRNTIVLVILLLLTGAVAPGDSAAGEPAATRLDAIALQDCGDWRYPVLCCVGGAAGPPRNAGSGDTVQW